MTEYKLSQKAISGYARAGMVRTTMIMAGILLGLLAILYYSPTEEGGAILYLEVVLPLFLIGYLFLLYNTRKRITRNLNTIQIFVEDKMLRKRMVGVPDIVIPISEVSQIRRKVDGSIMIVGPKEEVFMVIPVGIEGQPELERQLQMIRELINEEQEESKGLTRIPVFPFVLIGVVLFQIAESKWVILLGGSMLAGSLAVAVLRIWNNRDIPLMVRRFIWLFMFVAAYILYETYLRFHALG